MGDIERHVMTCAGVARTPLQELDVFDLMPPHTSLKEPLESELARVFT